MTKPATLIIISYQAPTALKKCLNSIEKESLKNIPLIVVDNNSSDPKVEEILKNKCRLLNCRLILNKTNLGFGRANNQAAKLVKSEWLILINNDTYWSTNELTKLINYLPKLDKDVVALGPRLIFPDGRLQPSAGYLPNFFNLSLWASGLSSFLQKLVNYHPYHLRQEKWYKKGLKPDWLMASFLAVRKDVYHQVGGFPTDIFMYGEDTILGEKLKKHGQIIFNPEFTFYHSGQASSNRGYSLYREGLFLIHYFKKKYGCLGKLYAQIMVTLAFLIRALTFPFLGRLTEAKNYLNFALKVALGEKQ